MTANKGFSLIEIIVVLVIVGILSAVMVPNLITASERTKAQTARNNLYAIAAAQQKYFEDHAVYYFANDLNDLVANLGLSISADSFAYSCTADLATIPSVPEYSCTAVDNTDTLTLSVVPNSTDTVATGVNVTCGPQASYCPDPT